MAEAGKAGGEEPTLSKAGIPEFSAKPGTSGDFQGGFVASRAFHLVFSANPALTCVPRILCYS